MNRVGNAQRVKLSEIQISSSMTTAFRGDANGHNYIGCGLDLIEGGLYAALKRIVVTCAGWSPEDEIDIRTPLHGMFLRFPEPGLEVQYKVAKSSD